jgi:hypothetical protein
MLEHVIPYLKKMKKDNGGVLPLLSVRSGARVSMPGMMDTVLNVGITPHTLPKWEKELGARAYDCAVRLVIMYADVVKGVKIPMPTQSDFESLVDVSNQYASKVGEAFPTLAKNQIAESIVAVWKSWNSPRAIEYRKINGIPDTWGTAVVIQRMVFGNKNDQSCSGVLFTRDPDTGSPELMGEFLVNAQGEDVVAGTATPDDLEAMEDWNPKVYKELLLNAQYMDKARRDMQDMEFTVEDGKLYILQTRSAKRSAVARFVTTYYDIKKYKLTKKEALSRITYKDYNALTARVVDPEYTVQPVGVGIGASGNIITGYPVFSNEEADPSKPCIFIANETTPNDLVGINNSVGILTKTGGKTCIVGKTDVVTSRGVYSAEAVHAKILSGEDVYLWSMDGDTPVWRKALKTIKKVGIPCVMSLGKKSCATEDVIGITKNHNMMQYSQNGVVKTPVGAEGFNSVICLKKLPEPSNCNQYAHDYMYLMGALCTDGYVKLTKRRGVVVFTQKYAGAKIPLVDNILNLFNKYFDGGGTIRKRKDSVAYIRGRRILGTNNVDVCSYRKTAAEVVLDFQHNLHEILIHSTKEQALHFLAGVADGDGSSGGNRLHLYISKRYLQRGVSLACVVAGVRAVAVPNRSIQNIQLTYGASLVAQLTSRFTDLKEGAFHRSLYRASQIPTPDSTITDYRLRNRFNEACKRDIMVCGDKMGIHLNTESQWAHVGESVEEQWVYDFTVESDTEEGHSYTVMSSGGRAVWISNSHAAVVARSLHKTCVVGLEELEINTGAAMLGGQEITSNHLITIDGATGRVWAVTGENASVPTTQLRVGKDVKALLGMLTPKQPAQWVVCSAEDLDNCPHEEGVVLLVRTTPVMDTARHTLSTLTGSEYSTESLAESVVKWLEAGGGANVQGVSAAGFTTEHIVRLKAIGQVVIPILYGLAEMLKTKEPVSVVSEALRVELGSENVQLLAKHYKNGTKTYLSGLDIDEQMLIALGGE